jgi:REP element-mobilizing transposase RayT
MMVLLDGAGQGKSNCPGVVSRHLAPTTGVEDLLDGLPESPRNADGDGHRRSGPLLLDRVDGLPRDPDSLSKLLLRKPLLTAKCPYPIAHVKRTLQVPGTCRVSFTQGERTFGSGGLITHVPRPLRLDYEDAIQHVVARGNRRQLIFRDDLDRSIYLRRLDRVVERQQWRCLAYCLMPNHVHLLVETPRATLADGMHELHGPYALRFNRRHGLDGHLFEKRYHNTPIKDDAQLLAAATYIALNPVAAGLCTSPELWPWSSHTTILGSPAPRWLDTDRLLEHLSVWGGDPRRTYLRTIEASRE